jgi:SNF2 family DNA or RNA helicase
MNLTNYICKIAGITYKDHQVRVADKLQNQRGVLVYHGLGSGKTLTSILAGEQNGGATVVVPASLRENYRKELKKARAKGKYDVDSYEMFAKSDKPVRKMLILDEAHRIRNSSTKRSQRVRTAAADAEKILLLTGTPIQNKPHEIAPLINTITGVNTLPLAEKEFNAQYLQKVRTEPGFFASVFQGARPSESLEVKNSNLFRKLVAGITDKQLSATEDFPSTSESTVRVPMSPTQLKAYRALESQAGAAVRFFVQNQLPADKQSSKNLNAFASGVRQIANTEKMFMTKDTGLSPKIQAVVDSIEASKGPALVYSNYLDSGVRPLQKALERRGISNSLYTGELNRKEKEQIVKDYNEGGVKALLVSSSGGEGLDLKNTRQVHVMEPHWHDAKIEQVIGRAARYKSHEALPEDERNVKVVKYISTLPNERGLMDKMLGGKGTPKVGIDQYLYSMSERKKGLNQKFLDML